MYVCVCVCTLRSMTSSTRFIAAYTRLCEGVMCEGGHGCAMCAMCYGEACSL